MAKGGKKTGGDRAKLAKALERKGQRMTDREKNIGHSRAEEHSRGPKRRKFF